MNINHNLNYTKKMCRFYKDISVLLNKDLKNILDSEVYLDIPLLSRLTLVRHI